MVYVIVKLHNHNNKNRWHKQVWKQIQLTLNNHSTIDGRRVWVPFTVTYWPQAFRATEGWQLSHWVSWDFFLHRAFTVIQMLATGFLPLTFPIPQSSQFIPSLADRLNWDSTKSITRSIYCIIRGSSGVEAAGVMESLTTPQQCTSRLPNSLVRHY